MKVLSYIVLFFCILILFTFCSSRKNNLVFDENLIQIISENPEHPSYAFSMFFVQGEDGNILKLEPWELEKIYVENYPSWNHKKFIKEAINQRIVIKTKKGKAFRLDKDVSNNYISNNFPEFIKIYCDNDLGNDKFRLKNNIEEHQLLSIFYYFFINNYLTEFDDGSGFFYILKTSLYYE